MSRDFDAFGAPDIKQELQALGCRYIAKFEDGLRFLRSELRRKGLHAS